MALDCLTNTHDDEHIHDTVPVLSAPGFVSCTGCGAWISKPMTDEEMQAGD